MGDWTIIVVGVAIAVFCGAAGWFLNNRFGRKSLEAAIKRADETIRNARREAEKAKRAGVLEVKQEILARRNKADRDLRSRRGQLQKRERDLKASIQARQEEQAALDRAQEEIREGQAGVADQERELETERERLARLNDEQNEASRWLLM